MFQVNQRWWAEEGESRSVLADAIFDLSKDEINATTLKKGLKVYDAKALRMMQAMGYSIEEAQGLCNGRGMLAPFDAMYSPAQKRALFEDP